mmetsp:Transcript_9485/g.28041  ORF Transcript_9485/g.28041 Transcript_9485/m.28041 type:complete len:490 (-) Transcript_9485:218-1687(-)
MMPHRTCSARERKRHGAFGAPAGRDALCKSHERSRSVVSLSGGHTTICSRGKRERTSSRTQHAREPIPYALQRWVTLNGPGAAPRATPTLALHRRRLRKAGSDGQARQEALLHRLREFLQRTRRVVHEDGVGLGLGANVLHHVEVLRDDHQIHDRLGVDADDLRLEGVDRLAQALHDGLPLPRDTLAAQKLGLRVGLGLDLGAARLRLPEGGRADGHVTGGAAYRAEEGPREEVDRKQNRAQRQGQRREGRGALHGRRPRVGGRSAGGRSRHLGLLDGADLDRLALVLRRDAQPLHLVDLVHRALHLRVGVNVGDRGREDLVAKRSHGHLKLLLDVLGDLLLGREHVVQLDLRHRRAHDVEDIRLDLRARVGEAVVRGVDRLVVCLDLELDGDLDGDEDVVLGLGLAHHLHLLQTHRDGARHAVHARHDDGQTRARDMGESAAALDDLDGALAGGDARKAAHGVCERHEGRGATAERSATPQARMCCCH